MNEPDREGLIEEAVLAWRPRTPDGRILEHPAWADLDEAGRQAVFEETLVMRALEAAWQHALPGRQSCARDHVMRELWRLLQQQPAAPSRCACVWSAPRAC